MSNASAEIGAIIVILISLCIGVVSLVCSIASTWKILEKAGEPAWAAFVPLMSQYKICKISLGIGWLFLLLFIPGVNFIMCIILCIKLSEVFGKGLLFAIGMMLLPVIFFMILGFGSATYHKSIPI